MLLSFRVENHKSIREEQQLLLTPVYDDARPEEADWKASTVAGIFGANASGKSNILDALSLMGDTVRWSMSANEPGAGMRRYPFALEREAQGEPSTFVVDLVVDGVRHTYGFAIDDDHVVEEWLYSYPKQRKRVVFERDGGNFEFGDHAPGKLRQVTEITGENVLFLTVAARAKNEVVEPIYRWFSEGLSFATERRPGRPRWLRDGSASQEMAERLAVLLKSADTGIESIELQMAEGAFQLGAAMVRRPGRLDRKGQVSPPGSAASGIDGPAPGAFIAEQVTAHLPSDELLFHHRGDGPTRSLKWEEESLGTRALATMGYDAQRVLENGGILVVDEIDASLHPYLSATVISLFQDEKRNPKGAQLVFTSHDAALLGRVRGAEVLKRDHIWFVDKDGEGRTSLYPLSDFKPRGDDNRSRRYLTGRYGAVPDVDDELFRDALRRREHDLTPEEAPR